MLVSFDRAPTFNEFDTISRATWSAQKSRPVNSSYRFWGDEGLLGEWQLFIAQLVREGAVLPERVISCATLMDLDLILEGLDPKNPRLPDLRIEPVLRSPAGN